MIRKPNDTDLQKLLDALDQLLRAHSTGLGEYALMEILSAQALPYFQGRRVGDTLQLFRRHFVLFHCLYRLRDTWRARGEADLTIHTLQIRRSSYSCPRSAVPAREDRLKDYYLDWNNWEHTDADEVTRLLRGFHTRARARQQRNEALHTLGLKDPVPPAMIKQTYRRLVMQHHPDRGGDTQLLQRLNAAMRVLNAGQCNDDSVAN